jgi:hypothetical protein
MRWLGPSAEPPRSWVSRMPNVGWHPDPDRSDKWRKSFAVYRASLTSRIPERFWSKVAKSEGCWEWIGSRSTSGYGQFYLRGRLVQAHRAAWEIVNDRPFPDGMLACHHCDNKICVRPDHLFVGTLSMNALDAEAKGLLRHYGNAKHTYCRNGHQFSPENTSYRVHRPTGALHRRCRACHRAEENRRRTP